MPEIALGDARFNKVSGRDVVVFDLGGVLARICHTWEEAADVAGVPHDISPGGPTRLADFSGFDLYQAGKLPFDVYLKELALFIGCPQEDALSVHNSIIIEEYPGVDGLVADIQAKGYRTGCLSNTNAAHWEHLALNGRFPVIAALQMKMASHLAGINKPDPKVYALYCEEFEVSPAQILFFDDHPDNVAAANRAGWLAAQIRPGDDTALQVRNHMRVWGVDI